MIESDVPDSPWLALISFTDAELALTDQQTEIIDNMSGIEPSENGQMPAIPRTNTMAITSSVSQLYNFSAKISQPIAQVDAKDPTPISFVPLSLSLFQDLFPKDSVTGNPDISNYRPMSHVRSLNTAGMADGSGTVEKFATTVCPRTGPPRLTQGQTMYTHLVSLAGVSSMTYTSESGLAALVSLYSWSYTCIPPDDIAVSQLLANLGANIQPFRNADGNLTIPRSVPLYVDDWVKLRSLSGYTLLRHRKETGEPTLAIQRGLLTPVKMPQSLFPPSDDGKNLAVIDQQAGILDLTFQLAWELGRMTAMADRTFAASIMRLRQAVHETILKSSKFSAQTIDSISQNLSRTFITTPTAVTSTVDIKSSLVLKAGNTNLATGGNRWQQPPTEDGSRSILQFADPHVRDIYQTTLASGLGYHDKAVPTGLQKQLNVSNPTEIYDETNSPLSTDYAGLLSWVMDKWFLQGFPIQNLLPEPNFVPKESIRTFYVDQSWFKAYIDGALSIAEHYTDTDDVREAIKKSLTTYLNSSLPNGFKPQVPKWGFFLRSELVLKFPNLKVIAPWPTDSDARVQVLRCDVIDSDLLLVLFDREPGDFTRDITISPPSHQGVSMFGDSRGIIEAPTTSTAPPYVPPSPAKAIIVVPYKHVFTDYPASENPVNYSMSTKQTVIQIDDSNGFYDLTTRLIESDTLVKGMLPAQPDSSVQGLGPTAALLGSQLLAVTPELVITDPAPANQASVPSLLSSKRRVTSKPFHPPPPSPITARNLSTPTPIAIPSTSLVGDAGSVNLMIANTDIENQTLSYTLGQTFVPNFFIRDRQPGRVVNGQGSYLSTRIFNISLPYYNFTISDMDAWTFCAVYSPTSYGFTTDLQINTVSLAPSLFPTVALTGVSFSIPVGNGTSDMLAPFPQTASPQAAVTTADSLLFKPRSNVTPNLDNTSNVPVVRYVGFANRWIVTTKFEPATAATATTAASQNGTLWITLDPNIGYTKSEKSDPKDAGRWWDIVMHRDLSIVLEDVRVNWWGVNAGPPPQGDQSYFKVGVSEGYLNLHDSTKSYVFEAEVDVTVQARAI